MNKIITLICVFATALVCRSEILQVPGADYPNIQAAIDSAAAGDTVLVAEGTYFERIDFHGKNIIVASRFLTESDTAYINSTVIDGQNGGSVVTFQGGEDSTAQLIGFRIENGFVFPGDGAGIRCINGSGPTLRHLVISNNISGNGAGIFAYNNSHIRAYDVTVYFNRAYYFGAGVYCDRKSSVTFARGQIISNTASGDGGGLYLNDSSAVQLQDVRIADNYAGSAGGAIFASGSHLELHDTRFTGNGSFLLGGGIFFEDCYETLIDSCTFTRNTAEESGGGMLLLGSQVTFRNSRIHHNHAYSSGGGIYSAYSELLFDQTDRCDIFLNFAGIEGNDLYAEDEDLYTIQLDTTTVLPVTDYQLFPFESFEINALAGKVTGAGGALYVSPLGSDDNDGLSSSAPLRTIAVALTKITADSIQPGVIYLQPGSYGNFQNHDFFPLNMRSHTRLSGGQPADVVLDGSFLTSILAFSNDRGVEVEKMTIQNAYGYNGGAVYMDNSRGSFRQTIFLDNNADLGSAIYLENDSRADLLNTTLVNNPAYGVVYLNDAEASVVNSIFWLNGVEAVVFDFFSDPNTAVIAFSDIEGGQEGLYSTSNGSLHWLSGNIDLNPMFADSLAYDLRLQPGSPAIDTGCQDTVLFYNEGLDSLLIRALAFNDNAPDMGALESGEPNRISPDAGPPERYILYQNYPNPFNPATTIRYAIPRSSDVKLIIYNNLGQVVRTFDFKGQGPGTHDVRFEGSTMASGIYYYVVTAGTFKAGRKMLLIK